MAETLTKPWDGITLREKMCDVGSVINIDANSGQPGAANWLHLFDLWERAIRRKDNRAYVAYAQGMSDAWRGGNDSPLPHVVTDIHAGKPTLYWRTPHY